MKEKIGINKSIIRLSRNFFKKIEIKKIKNFPFY